MSKESKQWSLGSIFGAYVVAYLSCAIYFCKLSFFILTSQAAAASLWIICLVPEINSLPQEDPCWREKSKSLWIKTTGARNQLYGGIIIAPNMFTRKWKSRYYSAFTGGRFFANGTWLLVAVFHKWKSNITARQKLHTIMAQAITSFTYWIRSCFEYDMGNM